MKRVPWILALAALFIGATLGYLLSRGAEPTTSHFVFIPSVLMVGLVLGYVLGGRAARDASAAQSRAEAAKAARRAAREASKKD